MLTVRNLNYEYGAQQVLSNISFDMGSGLVAVLAGRNGAGKSTLLRCLAGWTFAEEGEIEINGVNLREDDRNFRKQVMLVPDTPDFYDELTAWEHMQFIAQVNGIKDWKQESVDLLDEFQLFEHRKSLPFTYSRGMRYKLALCMALLIKPPLLLLDEPLGPLDATSQAYLWQRLKEYGQEEHSVLFSTHSLPQEKPEIFYLLRSGRIDLIEAEDVDSLEALLAYEDDEEPIDDTPEYAPVHESGEHHDK